MKVVETHEYTAIIAFTLSELIDILLSLKVNYVGNPALIIATSFIRKWSLRKLARMHRYSAPLHLTPMYPGPTLEVVQSMGAGQRLTMMIEIG